MKNKLLKTLLVSTTALPLGTTFGLMSFTSCAMDNEKEDFIVEGVVTDTDGRKLSDVNVSCNGKTTKTDDKGHYAIECTNGAPIYFDKYEYIGQTKTDYSFDKDVNVVLVPHSEGIDQPIKGRISKYGKYETLKYGVVTFYPDSPLYKKVVHIDGTGVFSTTLKIAAEGATDVPFTVHSVDCDSTQQILTCHPGQSSYVLYAQPYQYDVQAFVDSKDASKKIIMHAHHIYEDNTQYVDVQLDASYKNAFTEQTKYTLTFDTDNENQSSPIEQKISDHGFSVTFNSKEALSKVGETGKLNLVKVRLSENKLCLHVLIPNEFYDLTTPNAVGLHLTGPENGRFQPFDHKEGSTLASNQLCYVRLNNLNEFYQASDNANPFYGLTWDTQTGQNGWVIAKGLDGNDMVGRVGPIYNFGYQIKLAKNTEHDTGIYIMTKFLHDQMGQFFPDGYKPHFFFDVHEYGDGKYPDLTVQPADDGLIKHYAAFSGYWMKKYTVKGPKEPFVDELNYDKFYDGGNKEPTIYSQKDFMITFIPYAALWGGKTPANGEFGFSCNLQYRYTSDEWQPWVGDNPTGLEDAPADGKIIPHFEYLATYIRFNSKLEVIPYPQPEK